LHPGLMVLGTLILLGNMTRESAQWISMTAPLENEFGDSLQETQCVVNI